MSHDTTVDSLHVSQWVDADAAEVYEFAADPANLGRWAAGLADPQLATAEVRFVEPNAFGVLDHVVTLPDGTRFYNPMRVIPAGLDRRGCEVVFTVRRVDGVTDEQFASDAAAVAADLATLRSLVEKDG
ncbi:SRPBCC family protein [Mycobacterium yunnanensis]|uniref:SRPBCC family protein n=1 Tax=Mycobacterium yunnanensis TaxID=368477 RepID=A0A9X3BUL3_9MYCO|nr:SRPBCC family protein [Mycobacterium yunnanensis]MCV7422824.1 SRPBCC family protein [Mycobacterium yunnanensis]